MKVANKKIVYTGDTCNLNSFKPFLNDVDEFYVDTSKNGGVHLKIDDILYELKKIKENRADVYLMHTDDKKYIKNVAGDEFIIV